MTTEHTKGRLEVKHCGYDGLFIHIQQIDGDPYPRVLAEAWSEKDARRLVAAWNACDGVPTELLENLVDDDGSVTPFYRDLLVQRDELLEALKLAHSALRQASTDIADWGAYAPAHFQSRHKLSDDVQAYMNAAESARAAIAKVEQK